MAFVSVVVFVAAFVAGVGTGNGSKMAGSAAAAVAAPAAELEPITADEAAGIQAFRHSYHGAADPSFMLELVE